MVSWRYVAVSFARYFGIPALILGILGDVLNIFIFLTVRTYHRTPSTFYLLCAVIANFIQLTALSTTRISNVGFNNDLTRSSLAWCKLRQYMMSTYRPLALTCESLAAIDQFLVTSRNARIRRLSNIKSAHRIVAGFVLFWHMYSIPYLIYNDIQENRCVITNKILSIYWSTAHFFLVLMALPIIVLITFGFLAYRNMQRLINTNQLNGADRQLVIMICLQLVLVIISVIPFGIYNTYILITSNVNKSVEQMDQDFFFLTFSSLLSIFDSGGSFYVYIVASKRFRQIVRKRLFICWNRTPAVHPINTIAVPYTLNNPHKLHEFKFLMNPPTN